MSGVQPWLDERWRPGPERRRSLEHVSESSERARAAIALAETRLATLVDRQLGPAIAALVAGLFLHPGWAAVFVLVNLLSEIVDTRLNLHILHRAGPEALAENRLRPLQIVNAALNAGSHCFYVAVCWLEGPPELRIFCFSFLGLAALYTALHVNAVREIANLREGLYLLTLAALCLHDFAYPPAPGSILPWLQAIVAVTIGARMWVWVGLMLARHEKSLAAAREAEGARDEALRVSAARTRFFAVVSHELRTPLNGMLGMAQSLLGDDLSPAQREKAEVIAESGRTLTALLSDVLDLSKMEAGRLEIHPLPESLHAGLRHVIQLYRPLAEEKSLELRLEIADGVPDWLVHDGVRLRQCLSNLVSNAIKFTERGGVTVSVTAARVADLPTPEVDLRIEVADSGIGLDPAKIDTLFEPFVQADGSIPRQYGGTGLGLSISRRLARLMGGDIACRPGEAGGAVFTLSFRGEAAPAPAVVAKRAEGLPEQASGEGLRVLVADDVETNRAVARLFLEPVGFAVSEAADGEEAIARLRAEEFDAALIDLQMPKLSGEGVVRAIRAGRAGDPGLPTLAVTADHMADAQTLKAQGFDGLVVKPMDQRALQMALMSLVAAHLVSRRPLAASGA